MIEDLHPCFLGAHAENAEVLEDLIVEFLRDHVYWRRNFHPEDTPPIPTSAQYRDDYIDFLTSMKKELYSLSADLKKSVPWFSPRYVGHMASDLLLPGLIANLVTTLYNPNNVAEEAAPATLTKEIEVGFQLAEMFGYDTNPEAHSVHTPCAWGHLTSGGTVANYEGLRNFIALRFYPLAVAEAARQIDLQLGAVGPLERPLADYSDWQLFQISVDDTVALRRAVLDRIRREHDRETFRRFTDALTGARLEKRGLADFYRDHPGLQPPVVIVPRTAHYSWAKAMKVLNLGTSKLVEVQVDGNMRMDIDHLEELLDDLRDRKVPVLAGVGVLGNTEFGTVDPIGDLIATRDRFADEGFYFPVHIDAAWGGYLASVFRKPDGGLVKRKRLQKEFHYFPSHTVYEAFAALAEAESITVDPHKLGYVPYPAGAYVARNAGMIDFIPQRAAYVFDIEDDDNAEAGPGEPERGPADNGGDDGDGNLMDRLHHLGQYILEGSKPGAAAASVHVTHEVVPLHTDGFGDVLKGTIRASEYFYDRLDEFSDRLDDQVEVTIPFEPDSNLVCLAINPVGNRSLARMNRFGRKLFDKMSVDPSRPIQQREFISSYTSLLAEDVPPRQARRLLEPLGVDPVHLTEDGDNPGDSDHVFLIRNTLMNPWLLFETEGRNYIDRYLDFLAETIVRLLGS